MNERLSPERTKIEKLSEWLKARQIELVLFDLDDTLIDTHRVFEDQENKFLAHIQGQFPFFDFQDLSENLNRLHEKYFASHSVNPVKSHLIVGELAEVYQERLGSEAGRVFQQGLPLLLEVYRTVPAFHPGAEETLAIFKATGVDRGFVTHGNLTWTNLKIRGLDLARFFQHFWIADEDEFKGPQDWLIAINWLFGKKPENTLVVGDNVKGDIQAAHLVGVRHKVLIPGCWNVYTSGEIPEGTIKVPSINQLISALIHQA